MAIREYIGARYVPRFMETYNASQVYEALDVVDNGLGTSYIAKVPTPAGTPLTDTNFWAVYGASSGAIINLQNQIDTINSNVTTLQGENVKKTTFIDPNITLTRFTYTNYVIDVIKIPRTNQDGSVNKPLVNGRQSLSEFYDLTKNSAAAVNAGFMDANGLVGQALCNGILLGTQLGATPDLCYLAIDDDGKFHRYAADTDLSTMPSNIKNVTLVWCPLIENGAISPLIKTTVNTNQQQIGYDSDMNYYIITTSYKCPLNWSDLATWIMTHIPDIDTVYALDSGGSTQTSVNCVRTNLETDFTTKDGRRICNAIYFPQLNNSNLNVLSELTRIIQFNNAPVCIFKNETYSPVQVAEGVNATKSAVYQIGNLVTGSITFNVTSDYPLSQWKTLSIDLPEPDSDVFFTIYGTNMGGNEIGRMALNKINSQMDASTSSEVRFTAVGDYDCQFTYVTKRLK